jgi:hypothetical protein
MGGAGRRVRRVSPRAGPAVTLAGGDSMVRAIHRAPTTVAVTPPGAMETAAVTATVECGSAHRWFGSVRPHRRPATTHRGALRVTVADTIAPATVRRGTHRAITRRVTARRATADRVTARRATADRVTVRPAAVDRVTARPGAMDRVTVRPGAMDQVTARREARRAIVRHAALPAIAHLGAPPVAVAAEIAAGVAVAEAAIAAAAVAAIRLVEAGVTIAKAES